MNLSDKYRLIKKGLYIAEAYQIDSILENEEVNFSPSDSEGDSEEHECVVPEH